MNFVFGGGWIDRERGWASVMEDGFSCEFGGEGF